AGSTSRQRNYAVELYERAGRRMIVHRRAALGYVRPADATARLGECPTQRPEPRRHRKRKWDSCPEAERGSRPVGPLRYREVCFATFAQTLRATIASFKVMDGRASVASTTQYS